MGDVVQTFKDTVNTLVVAPVASAIETTKKIAEGDIKGAATTVAGAVMNTNPVSQTINSSSNVKDLLNTKEVNNLTLGLSGDAVKATEAQNALSFGADLTDEQMRDIGLYNAKAAAMVGAGIYAANSGLAADAGTWIANNSGQALTAGVMIAQGKGNQVLAGVANSVAPGLGDALDPILNPPAVRTPASTASNTGGVGTATDNYSVGSIDSTTKIALGAAAFMVLLVFIKKFKKR
jgi:hypothetical protein